MVNANLQVVQTVITALCAVIILNRRYNAIQWCSLLFLGLGVASIQLGPQARSSSATSSSSPTTSGAWANISSAQFKGLLAVLISCFASAIAATYFELVLKKNSVVSEPMFTFKTRGKHPWVDNSPRLQSPRAPSISGSSMGWQNASKPSMFASIKQKFSWWWARTVDNTSSPPSLWIQNIQLSMVSLFCSAVLSLWTSTQSSDTLIVGTDSFFMGFNVYTWLVIGIQTIGGLLTGTC